MHFNKPPTTPLLEECQPDPNCLGKLEAFKRITKLTPEPQEVLDQFSQLLNPTPEEQLMPPEVARQSQHCRAREAGFKVLWHPFPYELPQSDWDSSTKRSSVSEQESYTHQELLENLKTALSVIALRKSQGYLDTTLLLWLTSLVETLTGVSRQPTSEISISLNL